MSNIWEQRNNNFSFEHRPKHGFSGKTMTLYVRTIIGQRTKTKIKQQQKNQVSQTQKQARTLVIYVCGIQNS